MKEEESFSIPEIPGKFSGTVSLTTDYRFRGVSQTDTNPAIQGSVDYTHDSGLYLGVWGSNVDFNDASESSMEADYYGGIRKEFNGFKIDLGFIYYDYPGADNTLHYDYFEPQVALGYDFGWASFAGSLNFSSDFFADSGEAYYPKFSTVIPLRYGFTADGYFARQYVEENARFGLPDYNTWGLGLGYNYKGLDFKVQYVDTSVHKSVCPKNCDAAVLFSVSKTL